RTLVCDYFHALLSHDPEDYASYHRLLEISAKFKDPSVLKANLARYRDNEHLHPYALRFQLLQAIDQKAWARADELFSEILLTGNEAVISFSRSRLFRASLDRRAEQRGIEPSRRVKLFWWEQPYPGNLGDIVNPYIVEKVTGIPPEWAGR